MKHRNHIEINPLIATLIKSIESLDHDIMATIGGIEPHPGGRLIGDKISPSFPIECYCPNTKERYSVCCCDECEEKTAEEAWIDRRRKEEFGDAWNELCSLPTNELFADERKKR